MTKYRLMWGKMTPNDSLVFDSEKVAKLASQVPNSMQIDWRIIEFEEKVTSPLPRNPIKIPVHGLTNKYAVTTIYDRDDKKICDVFDDSLVSFLIETINRYDSVVSQLKEACQAHEKSIHDRKVMIGDYDVAIAERDRWRRDSDKLRRTFKPLLELAIFIEDQIVRHDVVQKANATFENR